MSSKFSFTRNRKPVPARLEIFLEDLPTTFFALGIVNPMGPTMSMLASNKIGKPGHVLPIYQIMINPFQQSCHEVGQVEIGKSWNPAVDLAPFYELDWGACPSLLIPSALYDDDASHCVFAELLPRFKEGRKLHRQIQRFPGDPWKRVEDEVDVGALSRLKGIFRNRSDNISGPLSEAESWEFVETQLQPKNSIEEFKAFTFAWGGALDFTRMPGMSKDHFIKFFARFALTARTHIFQNIFDNPEILTTTQPPDGRWRSDR